MSPTPDLTSLVRAAPGASAVTLAVAREGTHHVYCHGRLSHGGLPNTPETAYEIGSVTKTFTALLLAELAALNRLGLHDPIDTHLPPAHRPRSPAGTRITLLHLATHTSGLPRLPPGLLTRALPTYFTNPYAHYRTEHFHHALGRTRTRRHPGSRLTYSNYGMGLLGHTLAQATGTDYPTLLTEHVCRPLGLPSTTCAPAPTHQATGHRRKKSLPPFTIPALPAAGALRSTGPDLLRYLQAHLAPTSTPLATALHTVQQPRLRVPRSHDHLCLAWNLREVGGRTFLFHSGATRGFTAFIGFCPQAGTALAALTNTGPHPRNRFVQTAYLLLKQLGT
ncbi:beta-lactamase family protein [Streptomyces sp. ISL-36]|uniref:serine hydrolase domain-containing protein n=1 Tax=Streptomyces sp. ISL-36 TaxID=2819182 RepID=UPI001BE9C5BA|nr:serine hydrolase domain-containing protein [Streptomyces sp. ISL-36]MBT2444997.1 beta-lactamase family protein [Streptomyces sp. ISL-36]